MVAARPTTGSKVDDCRLRDENAQNPLDFGLLLGRVQAKRGRIITGNGGDVTLENGENWGFCGIWGLP